MRNPLVTLSRRYSLLGMVTELRGWTNWISNAESACQPQPPLQWVAGALTPGVEHSVRITTYLHLASRLRMSGAIRPPL